jgi:hypothetical protein
MILCGQVVLSDVVALLSPLSVTVTEDCCALQTDAETQHDSDAVIKWYSGYKRLLGNVVQPRHTGQMVCVLVSELFEDTITSQPKDMPTNHLQQHR